MALSPVFVELKAATGEFRTKIGEAAGELHKLDKIGSGAGMKRMSVIGKAALTGVLTTALAVGAVAVHTADTFELSHAKLEQSLHNVNSSFDEWKPRITAVDKRMERLGFTNAQTEEGLGNLTTALKSPKLALDQVGLAADLARFKHISLADAATAMARAEEGNLRSLKQIGVDLPIASGGAAKLALAHRGLTAATLVYNQLLDKQHAKHHLTISDHIALENAQRRVRLAQQKVNETASTGKQIVGALSHLIGGQATAASETWAGKQERLKAQVADIATRVGIALIPKLQIMAGWISDHVVPALSSMGHWIGQNKAWLIPLVVAIGSFATGVYIAVKAVGLVTAVMEAFGAETTIALGPIGLIVGGIALLAAGLVMAYRHSETFRDIVKGTFHVVGVAIDFVRDHWRTFVTVFAGLLLGPFGAAIVAIVTHFGAIKSAAQTVFGAVAAAAGGVVGFFTGPFMQGIGFLVSNVVTGFKYIADVWFVVVGALVNGAASAFGWVPGIGGKLKHAAHAFNDFHRAADKEMQGVITDASHWGQDIGTNLVKGLTLSLTGNGSKGVIHAVETMADGTVHATTARYEIRSPSRVFHRIGLNVARGLAGGIHAGSRESTAAAHHMASQAIVSGALHASRALPGSGGPSGTTAPAYAPAGGLGAALLAEQRRATAAHQESNRLQRQANDLLELIGRAAAGKMTPAQLRTEMLKHKRSLGITGPLL